MNPNLSSVCRVTFFAAILLLITQISFAQPKEQIELKYKVDSVKIDNVYQYTITVKVRNGNGPYTFYLYSGMPWKGGQVMQESALTTKSTFTFSRVPGRGNYHVGVTGATNSDMNWTFVKP